MMSYTDPIKTRGVNPGARERYAVPVSLKKPAWYAVLSFQWERRYSLSWITRCLVGIVHVFVLSTCFTLFLLLLFFVYGWPLLLDISSDMGSSS